MERSWLQKWGLIFIIHGPLLGELKCWFSWRSTYPLPANSNALVNKLGLILQITIIFQTLSELKWLMVTVLYNHMVLSYIEHALATGTQITTIEIHCWKGKRIFLGENNVWYEDNNTSEVNMTPPTRFKSWCLPLHTRECTSVGILWVHGFIPGLRLSIRVLWGYTRVCVRMCVFLVIATKTTQANRSQDTW